MDTLLYIILSMCVCLDGSAVFQAISSEAEKPILGNFEKFGPEWSAELGPTKIARGELIELTQLGVPRPMFPWDRPHILLVNGDLWPGEIVGIKDDQIRFVPAFGKTQELMLPVWAVAIAWLTSPRSGELPDPTNFDLLSSKRQEDEAYLINKDVLKGTVNSMDRSGLKLDVNGKPVVVAVERLRAIAFNSELAKPIKPRGAVGHVILTSGARITLTEASLQDGRIVGTTLAGPELRLILSELVHLEVQSDRVKSLAALKPVRYDHTPYMSTRYPFMINRSTLENRPLKLGPHVFDRGIAVHSQSRLTYSIPNSASRFETWAGLDADVGKQGNVTIQIIVDGKVVLGPDAMTGTNVPKRIVITLPESAKELGLDVGFGAGGDMQDHFVWGDARFILPKSVRKP